MKLNNARNTERGFSLLELLLVIGVGALLLLAGLATYRIVTQGNNITEAQRLLNAAKIGIQTLYQNQATYGTNATPITDVVVNGGVFPSRYIVGGNPVDPWRNDIVVTAVNPANFTIALQNVPEAACVALGTAFTPESDADFVEVDINGTTLDGTAGNEVDVANTQGACQDDATNSLTWNFI
tara:strand:- start:750 stop:1295 length:546 start_codon:yes stop_codon:yes gene_type:complete